MVGLGDLKGVFQHEWFYVAMFLWSYNFKEHHVLMMSSCVHKPDLFWYFSGLQFSHLFFFHKYYSIWRAKQGGLVSEGWTGLSVGRRSSSSCNNHSTALQFVLPGKHKLDIVAPIQQAFWWPHKIILTAVESKWKGVGGDDWDFLGMSLYIRP